MATVNYSGSISGATGLNSSPSVSLSGYGSASGIIDEVTATLNFSTTAYSNYYDVTATLYFSGGSVSSSREVKMDSSNYSNGQFDFDFDGLTVDQANSIYAISASCSDNGSKIFLKGSQSVVVEYILPSRVSAPTSVSLSAATTTGATNTLSWSGAAAGTANGIRGYFVQYSDSSDGSSWNGWGEYGSYSTSATSYSITVNMPEVGKYRKFRVWTLGAVGEDYDSSSGKESSSAYRAYTPSAPGSLSPSAGGYTSLSTISWGAVSCTDAISYYQYQISTDNGSTWGATQTATNNSANIASTFASSSVSARLKFRVRAVTNKGIASSWATSGTFYRITAPTAPTVFTASPTSYESGNITLSWSGTKDEDSNVNGYEIQFATSSDGVTYTSYAALKSVSSTALSGNTTDAPTMNRGTYRKYRIRAKDSSGLTSAWKESNAVYRTLTATTPVISSPGAGYYENAPALSWSKSTAPDGNLAGYEYQISTNGGTSWGTARTTTGTTGTFPEFSSAARGTAFAFRVRAYTTLNAYSDWATSAVFYKNTAIVAPSFLAPASGCAIRNSQARIIISVPAKTNGIAQSLFIKYSSSGSWTTLASNQAGAFKKTVTAEIIATGAQTVYLKLTDAAGASVETSRTFSTVLPSFTDSTIIPGTTPRRAVHMTELREVVNLLRTAYGLSAKQWAEEIVAGTTSARHFNAHVAEVRTAINETASKINSLAGTTIVSAFSWCELSESGAKGEAITQIRNALSKL